MTHSTVNTELENQGSRTVAYHEINVTSLDSAGTETYDPSSELNIEGADRFGVAVRSQTNETLRAYWNETSQNLKVQQWNGSASGTAAIEDVPDNSSVGHFTLEVVGD